MFVATSLITVLFLGQAGINVGKLVSVIASLLFYAIPIAIVVYVISLVKRYVDCKVMESKNGCRDGCKDRTAEVGNQADQGHRWMELLKIVGSSSDWRSIENNWRDMLLFCMCGA